MTLSTPLQYFGRAIPVLLRRFPKLHAYRIQQSPEQPIPVKTTVELPVRQKGPQSRREHKSPDVEEITIHTQQGIDQEECEDEDREGQQPLKEAQGSQHGSSSPESMPPSPWYLFKHRKSKRKTTSDSKRLELPGELEGQLNLIVFGFGKYQMLREMFSWYPMGRAMSIELSKKYNGMDCQSDRDGREEESLRSNKTSTDDGNHSHRHPTKGMGSGIKTEVPNRQQHPPQHHHDDHEQPQYVNDGRNGGFSSSSVLSTPTDGPSASTMKCYTLFIFPRWLRIFHWWIQWRYKHLVRAYAVNKVKVKETQKLEKLARLSGLEDLNQDPKGPVPLEPHAADAEGEILDEEERNAITEKRMRAYHQYCRVRADAQQSWEFADGLIRNTLVVYLNRKKFLDSLQLPDKQRSYVALVNKKGKLFWFEYGRCTISKANDAFDRFKLDHLKICPSLLPRYTDLTTKLYGRVEMEDTLLLPSSTMSGVKASVSHFIPKLEHHTTTEKLEASKPQTTDNKEQLQ